MHVSAGKDRRGSGSGAKPAEAGKKGSGSGSGSGAKPAEAGKKGSGAKPAEAGKKGSGSGAKPAEADEEDLTPKGREPKGLMRAASRPQAVANRNAGKRGEETSDIELAWGSSFGAYSGPIQPVHANVHLTCQLLGK